MPKISVIIPVYNTEQYLATCLNSVLGQTFQDIEVICINDGSPDNSAQILQGYAEKDSRIRVITQENQGQSVARNAGLDVATGDWICFVDSDDALPENALKNLYDIVEKTNVKIVASRTRFVMKDDQKLKNYTSKVNSNYQVKKGGIKDFVRDPKIYSAPWNKLIHKDLFQNLRFPAGMVFEDWPIMTILFGHIDDYAIIQEACYIYRENNTSTTRSVFTQRKVDCYMRGIHIVYDAFKSTDNLKYAQIRIAVAVKMVVNKVYHAKNTELSHYTEQQVRQLINNKIICSNQLPIKTRYRLWRMKHC